MSLKNLTTSSDIAPEKDSIGTSRVKESGLYEVVISAAYLGKSEGGALSLNLVLKTEDDSEIKQTLWMTSGDKKGNKNYYLNAKKEKHYLPGFLIANSLSLLTVGKDISEIETEEKTINLYNYELKKDIPTKVDMLMELVTQSVIVGLIKQEVDKSEKDSTGTYIPTGETRTENEIDKLFRAEDRMTTAEVIAQAEEAQFINTWEAKWKDVTRDKTTKDAGNSRAGAPKSGAAKSVGTTSLFGKKA